MKQTQTEVLTKDKEKMVLDNLNLIYGVMSDLGLAKCQNADDIFQMGCLGLVTAAIRYDGKLNCKFSTFAYSYIKGYILRNINLDRPIKISRRLVYIIPKYVKYRDICNNQELMDILNVNEKELDTLRTTVEVVSLDKSIEAADDDLHIIDILADKSTDFVYELEEKEVVSNAVKETLKILKSKNGEKYYKAASDYVVAVMNGDKNILTAIGDKYGIDKQEVYIIVKKFKKIFKKFYV